MKPPSRIHVGPHVYRVLVEQRDTDCYGETDIHRCTIRLSPKQCDSQLRETFLHEITHACLAACGLNVELGEEVDEKVATRLAPILLDVLRRCPRVVEFLVER